MQHPRPSYVEHIKRARVYSRENSAPLWFSYYDPSDVLVRKSAGTTNVPEAWQRLVEDYQTRTELNFQDAAIQYFEARESRLEPSTIRQYAFSLKAMLPYFEGKPVKRIDIKDVQLFMDARRQLVSDASLKRDLAFLSSLFEWTAVRTNDQAMSNPVARIRKNDLVEVSRERYLTQDEFLKLLAACHQEVHRRIIQTAVYTGMRHGELLDFRREWINWEAGEIRLPAEFTKSKKSRVIPMSTPLIEVLKAQVACTISEHVFVHWVPREGVWAQFTTFKNFFGAACTRAEIKDLRFHDLRHTFGSWWAQSGGDIYALKNVMGHSTVKVTERYAHLNTKTLHKARVVMDKHISGTVTRLQALPAVRRTS